MAAPRVAVARWHSVPFESLKYYWQRLRDAGIEPFDLSPDASLDQCSGLVLTGGVDLDPALYGEAQHPKAQEPDRERDEFELEHLRRALELDMPVLAIC